MKYLIQDQDVYQDNVKIGTHINGLLKLDSKFSLADWDLIHEYLKKNETYNKKISRKKIKSHHSYYIINGEPFRVDHSVMKVYSNLPLPPLSKSRSFVQVTHKKGYLGSGAYGRVKTISSIDDKKYAFKTQTLNFNDARALFYQHSGEALMLQKYEWLVHESLRPTQPILNINDEYKTNVKHTIIMKYFSGADGVRLPNTQKLNKIEYYKFALLMILALNINHYGDRSRDVKPENIVINMNTKESNLCDFGFSLNLSDQADIYRISGCIGYIAPEIYLDSAALDKCDIYSLMVTLSAYFSEKNYPKEYQYLSQYIPDNNWLTDNIAHNKSITAQQMRQLEKLAAVTRPSLDILLQYFVKRSYKVTYPYIKSQEDQLISAKDEQKSGLYKSLSELYSLLDYDKAIFFAKNALQYAHVEEQDELTDLIKIRYKNKIDGILFHPRYVEALEVIEEAYIYFNQISTKIAEYFVELKRHLIFRLSMSRAMELTNALSIAETNIPEFKRSKILHEFKIASENSKFPEDKLKCLEMLVKYTSVKSKDFACVMQAFNNYTKELLSQLEADGNHITFSDIQMRRDRVNSKRGIARTVRAVHQEFIIYQSPLTHRNSGCSNALTPLKRFKV